MRPGLTAGASTSPGLKTPGPPNPARTIAFTCPLRGLRAPVVQLKRSPYYTAAQTGSLSGFLTSTSRVRNTEAAAARRDLGDHDPVSRGSAPRQDRSVRRRLSRRAGAHASAREREARRESDPREAGEQELHRDRRQPRL